MIRSLYCLLLVGASALTQASSLPDIERLVTLPKLDGTAPTTPTWSPDSSRIAFLWNDHGMPFRDVWLVDGPNSSPRRLSQHAPAAEDVLGTGPDLSLEALRERARQRQHNGVSTLIWHPDGQRILYVLNGRLLAVAVAVDEAGTEDLGAGGGNLLLSPDQRQLALLRGGDIWLHDLSDNTQTRLTALGEAGIAQVPIGAFTRPDAYISRLQFSPDGRTIAFEFVDQRQVRRVPFPSYLPGADYDEPLISEVRRPYPGDRDLIRRIGLIDVGSAEPRWLDLEGPERRVNLDFEFSPDGERLLIMQGADVAEERWIHIASLASGELRQVWHDQRPRRIYPIFRALWNHDGSRILFIGDSDGHYRLHELDPDTGASRALSGAYDIAGDRGAAWIARDPGSSDLFVISTEHSPYERHVHRLPADGGASQRLTRMAGLHQPTLAPDGSALALISSNDTTPAELYWLNLRADAVETRLTHSPLPEFSTHPWITPRYVSFPSRIDGHRIHARIFEPPGMAPGTRYPVLIGSLYSNTVLNQWTAERPITLLQQSWALAGDYITMVVDVRGSVGYGVDFREAFQGDWGRDDLEDIHSAVDYLTTLEHVDPDRIGVWGNSYGGLLVLSALFRKPGLFAAGVAGAPAVDIHHFTGFDQHLTRRPDTHPAIFEEGSLLDLGEQLQDPLLIIHGVHDDIVPLKTTLMLAEKLTLLGKDFELAIVHDSGHWWAQSEHYARYTFSRLDRFFRHHIPAGPR